MQMMSMRPVGLDWSFQNSVENAALFFPVLFLAVLLGTELGRPLVDQVIYDEAGRPTQMVFPAAVESVAATDQGFRDFRRIQTYHPPHLVIG